MYPQSQETQRRATWLRTATRRRRLRFPGRRPGTIRTIRMASVRTVSRWNCWRTETRLLRRQWQRKMAGSIHLRISRFTRMVRRLRILLLRALLRIIRLQSTDSISRTVTHRRRPVWPFWRDGMTVRIRTANARIRLLFSSTRMARRAANRWPWQNQAAGFTRGPDFLCMRTEEQKFNIQFRKLLNFRMVIHLL